MSGKRGRPSIAAKSLDEALHAVYSWRIPLVPLPRPRNAFERQAQRETRGAKRLPDSLTIRCAELAHHLKQSEGITRTAAIKQARKLIESELLTPAARARRAGTLAASLRTVGTLQQAPDEANVRRYLKEIERLHPVTARTRFEAGVMDVTAEMLAKWESERAG